VYGLFQCGVSIIDERRKDQLASELYRKRRAVVGGNTANTNIEDTEDEDLIGYDAIEPGLPPASSDRRKWWLDGGKFLYQIVLSIHIRLPPVRITSSLDNQSSLTQLNTQS
jgi:hypothetical protein